LQLPVLQLPLLLFPSQLEQLDPDLDGFPLPSLVHLAIATSSWLLEVGDACTERQNPAAKPIKANFKIFLFIITNSLAKGENFSLIRKVIINLLFVYNARKQKNKDSIYI
jgi:hypothetical protein